MIATSIGMVRGLFESGTRFILISISE